MQLCMAMGLRVLTWWEVAGASREGSLAFLRAYQEAGKGRIAVART